MSQVALRTATRGEPFGARAMMMGFATTEQIETALSHQQELAASGEKKLLGMILVEMQVINTTQLLAVLKTYEN
ncbi:MAG TPA: hypothetical protein VKX17_02180 [Planctomycetota bacterium]|nr:hypothetical protein [Planctomycetota bacterium]